ncbi:MAG: flagellar basal body rod C-terminal domain-containing protein, partial [Pseudomonadota bacterium]
LLDREVFELGFTATPVITQDMTLASGALSGLTLGGRAVEIGTGAGRLEGGALAAQFALRDVTGPAAGEAIDAFAAEIIGRFEAAGLDPTLTPGDPGLFTDAGAALDPLATEGLATRIAVNPTVDPAAGGELWRLRDGLGATVEGTAGDASLLNALLAAATTPSAPPTATGVSGAHGLADLAGALTGLAVQSASETDESAAYLLGQAASFRDAELASVGVDTDSELQKLLVIERTYAANARVIETLDGLLARLLEI